MVWDSKGKNLPHCGIQSVPIFGGVYGIQHGTFFHSGDTTHNNLPLSGIQQVIISFWVVGYITYRKYSVLLDTTRNNYNITECFVLFESFSFFFLQYLSQILFVSTLSHPIGVLKKGKIEWLHKIVFFLKHRIRFSNFLITICQRIC